jgi:rhodanese-related sulfurtransferase
MKKLFVLMIALTFIAGTAGLALSAENALRAQEAEINKSFASLIPADHRIDVFKLHEVWKKAMADPAYRKQIYLIDVRTDPEFYAFHIQGSDHFQAGHMYVITHHIADPNAEIYIWCRTEHRAKYVSGFLYKYGYKNVYCVEHTTKNGKNYYGGVVGWAQAGFPFVNQFAGEFTIHKYSQQTTEQGEYRIRLFHPY